MDNFPKFELKFSFLCISSLSHSSEMFALSSSRDLRRRVKHVIRVIGKQNGDLFASIKRARVCDAVVKSKKKGKKKRKRPTQLLRDVTKPIFARFICILFDHTLGL